MLFDVPLDGDEEESVDNESRERINTWCNMAVLCKLQLQAARLVLIYLSGVIPPRVPHTGAACRPPTENTVHCSRTPRRAVKGHRCGRRRDKRAGPV